MTEGDACAICRDLGESLFADFDRDEHFPDACHTLVMSMWFDDLHDLRRCPACGQYYDFRYRIDNDIFQPTHTGEYCRVTEKEAEAMMRRERTRIRKHHAAVRRALRRKYGKTLDALDDHGRRAVELMIADRHHDLGPEDLSASIGVPLDEAELILTRLVDRGLAWKSQGREKGDLRERYSLRW